MPISTATTIISHILNQHQSSKNKKELLGVLNKILRKVSKTEQLLSKKDKKKLGKGEIVLVAHNSMVKAYIRYLKDELRKTKRGRMPGIKKTTKKRFAEVVDYLENGLAYSEKKVEKKYYKSNKELKKMNTCVEEILENTKERLENIKIFEKINSKFNGFYFSICILGSKARQTLSKGYSTEKEKIEKVIEALKTISKKIKEDSSP